MGVVENLTERNAEFAKPRFNPELRMRPALAAIVIWCADTRVDPAVVLGAEQGEIMTIRNVGGRYGGARRRPCQCRQSVRVSRHDLDGFDQVPRDCGRNGLGVAVVAGIFRWLGPLACGSTASTRLPTGIWTSSSTA